MGITATVMLSWPPAASACSTSADAAVVTSFPTQIRAMSSEAKTGAWIIGSLPPGVAGIVFITTPDYIKPLFTMTFGNFLLLGCAFWMSIGVLIMKKMISFRY